jgi:hypothetical protein
LRAGVASGATGRAGLLNSASGMACGMCVELILAHSRARVFEGMRAHRALARRNRYSALLQILALGTVPYKVSVQTSSQCGQNKQGNKVPERSRCAAGEDNCERCANEGPKLCKRLILKKSLTAEVGNVTWTIVEGERTGSHCATKKVQD